MNTGSFPSDAHLAVSLQPEWQLQINRWRELLASCLYKPNGKRIHDLRSFTLRLSVSLEYWLLMHLPDPVATRAYRRWNNEGKRLQQALRPVRDADVYLTRLACLRAKLGESPGYTCSPLPALHWESKTGSPRSLPYGRPTCSLRRAASFCSGRWPPAAVC